MEVDLNQIECHNNLFIDNNTLTRRFLPDFDPFICHRYVAFFFSIMNNFQVCDVAV